MATPFLHLTLACRDVEKTAGFFERTMGWRRLERPGNIEMAAVWLEIAPGQELHLLEVEGFEVSPFEAEFGRHAALVCDARDWTALQERLQGHGATIIPPERPTSFRRFFFRTPDGYVFEVVEGG